MMPGKSIRILLPVLALCAAAASACGTVATPEWAAEAQGTQAALLVTSEHLTEIAPTATATTPPTATPVPPTATTVPTEVPTEAPTEPPTAVPTVEATPEAAAGGDVEITGNAENGQVVFTTPHETASGTWSCAQCHSVTADEARLIGPGLWNINLHAETRVEGQSAYDYIHESIVDPNAFIAPGDPPYPPNLMPQNWGEVLTPEELDDLIAYLYTLND
jgi:mono/diheme cytochrome c family protein